EQISQKSEKVIIFCDDHDTQSRIAAAIRQHLQLPHPVECLHDDMPLADRHDAAARFQKRKAGFDVLVLSPATDLSAMDLTAANHVFHFSRGWNPALEDRAIACVHRIGQSRDVTVYLPQSVHPDEAIRPFSLDLVLHRFMERERARPHAWLGAENTDQDILTLFNEVIGALPDLPPPAPVSPPPVAPPASRPRLGIRKPPPAAPAPAIRAPLHDRVVFAQGGPRDMAIFTKPLAQDPIRTLRIIDPYAAAGDRARQNTVRFAQRLLGEGRGGQSVLLVTFDTQDVSTYHAETSNDQYDDMHQRWARAFNGKVDLEYVQVARNGNRDLHDREVRATTQSGRHFIWDVGRGIDGVMKNNHRCVVVLTEGIAP
ncbi:MAG: helicase-related protein, partial [Novosphingobium sp.]